MTTETKEQACHRYIDLLENTSPHAPVNYTHHVLRALYIKYGQENVESELHSQFLEREQR